MERSLKDVIHCTDSKPVHVMIKFNPRTTLSTTISIDTEFISKNTYRAMLFDYLGIFVYEDLCNLLVPLQESVELIVDGMSVNVPLKLPSNRENELLSSLEDMSDLDISNTLYQMRDTGAEFPAECKELLSILIAKGIVESMTEAYLRVQ